MTVTGVGGHGAQPHLACSPVNAAHRPIMRSEDFTFMLQAKPGNYIFTGSGAKKAADGRGVCMVHSPRYYFNDEFLPISATYWVELVKELLPAA